MDTNIVEVLIVNNGIAKKDTGLPKIVITVWEWRVWTGNGGIGEVRLKLILCIHFYTRGRNPTRMWTQQLSNYDNDSRATTYTYDGARNITDHNIS